MSGRINNPGGCFSGGFPCELRRMVAYVLRSRRAEPVERARLLDMAKRNKLKQVERAEIRKIYISVRDRKANTNPTGRTVEP